MDFISNQEPQIQEILTALGIQNIAELFEGIPTALKVASPQKDDGLSECEGLHLMEELAAKNIFPSFESYLGAGAYEHHVPALVGPSAANLNF